MPNPPNPKGLRIIEGNHSKRSIRPELSIELGPECPPCPDFLSGFACDEWHRVAPVLWSSGLLSPLDSWALAAYCSSYETWREAIELGEAASSARDRAVLLKIARRARGEMCRYGAPFVIWPSNRPRLAPSCEGHSKFDGFLGA